jgi:hypothetical protein
MVNDYIVFPKCLNSVSFLSLSSISQISLTKLRTNIMWLYTLDTVFLVTESNAMNLSNYISFLNFHFLTWKKYCCLYHSIIRSFQILLFLYKSDNFSWFFWYQIAHSYIMIIKVMIRDYIARIHFGVILFSSLSFWLGEMLQLFMPATEVRDAGKEAVCLWPC